MTVIFIMYGKHFASMYTGSMVGAGALVFAVMGYVIANMRPDEEVGAQVELNPKLIAMILGEKESDVQETINFLCNQDPNSRTPEEGGRRLVKLGQFDYRVVNGAKYVAIRNEEERRAYNRDAKRRQRDRKRPAKRDLDRARKANEAREDRAETADRNGDQDLSDQIAAEGL